MWILAHVLLHRQRCTIGYIIVIQRGCQAVLLPLHVVVVVVVVIIVVVVVVAIAASTTTS
jgi:hypothetical protein